MKFLVIMLTLVMSFSALAEQRIQKLFSNGEIKAGYVSLFLSDGEIVHFHKNNSSLLSKARSAYNNSSVINTIKVSVNSESADIIADINILSSPRMSTTSERRENTVDFRLLPTDTNDESIDPRDPLSYGRITRLSSYDDAQKVMETFNGETHDKSQCYNRATMWTYEAQVKKKVNLGKIWIFFTKRYISEYDYKWWFHIAPYADVNGGKYILDRGFTMIPYTVENWKNIFIKSGASCPVIKDYRQYENNQYSQHCYLIYSNQYYWQPFHLENLSKRGQVQTNYSSTNLRRTYKDALRHKWNGRIPRPSTRPDPDTDTGRNGALRVGEVIINTNGLRGRVTRVYPQGRVVDVRYDGYRNSVVQSVKDLAVTYGSSGGFHVGNKVYARNNGAKGKIAGIFKDGRLSVKFKRERNFITLYPRDLLRY